MVRLIRWFRRPLTAGTDMTQGVLYTTLGRQPSGFERFLRKHGVLKSTWELKIISTTSKEF